MKGNTITIVISNLKMECGKYGILISGSYRFTHCGIYYNKYSEMLHQIGTELMRFRIEFEKELKRTQRSNRSRGGL